MSKVDDVFDFADELIDEWGQTVTLVLNDGNPIYNPETERLQTVRLSCK